ncbi:MAG TPA: N-acetylmuramoyl-L-alanine amidase [Myxococcaceae bacterium]|nr:N-acetylmuramoyl-L-alanine amidase [Myxococcaceae bacterium]
MLKRWLCALALFALPVNAAAIPADEALLAAKSSDRALKADPAKRKLRHHWINAAKRYEQVAGHYPQSARAPEALLLAAQLLSELSQISRLDEDLDAAIADCQKLIDSYPKHPSSDGAALLLGRIYFKRRGEHELARRVATQALARHPRSARAEELKSLLAELPEEPKRAKVQVRRKAPEPVLEKGRRRTQESLPRTGALLEAIARVGKGELPAAATRSPAEDRRERPEGDRKASDPKAGEEAVGDPEGDPDPSTEPSRAPVEREASAQGLVRPPPVAIDPAKRARAIGARARSSDASLAEQLGLKFRRVVIDPGHGGHDTGAIGGKGTREKDVALAISLRLRDLLVNEGLTVIVTRTDDSFVRLEDRALLANSARGDLFISIHCNSAPKKKLHGIETYTLNTSGNRYSIRLAARENASSERGVSDLQYILADLATKANTEESSRLAARVQQSLVSQLRARHRDVQDLGTKEALFYVLLGVRMPAILVETSFLSNPEEERRLSSKAYQGDVAKAIAAAIHEFLGSRQQVAKVN